MYSVPQVSTGRKDSVMALNSQTVALSRAPGGRPVGWLVQPWKLMTGGGKHCWQQHVIGRWNPASSLRLNSKPSVGNFLHLMKQYGPSSSSSLHRCKEAHGWPRGWPGPAGLVRAGRHVWATAAGQAEGLADFVSFAESYSDSVLEPSSVSGSVLGSAWFQLWEL